MFRCDVTSCNIVVPCKQPMNKVVTKRRDKQYKKIHTKGRHKDEVEFIDGWEIVEEISVCPDCFLILTGEEPRRYIVPRVTQSKNISYSKPRFKKRTKLDDKKNIKRGKDYKQRSKPIVEIINRMPGNNNDKKSSSRSIKVSRSHNKRGI